MSAPPRTSPPKLTDLALELETPRLKLRPFVDADVDAIWPYVSDPAFPKHMTWSAHADRAETHAFIAGTRASLEAGTDLHWAITRDGVVVGAISLLQIRWQLRACRYDRAEIAYWLGTPFWNQGLMTEAAHHVMLFAFDTLGLHKVSVGSVEDNIGSRRVIEKLGFRRIGLLEEDVWRDGQWHSVLRYELTASKWSDVSTTMPLSRPHRI